MGDAGVAPDAAQDLVQAPFARLQGKLGVRDQRARHTDGVAALLGEKALGLERVDDARGRKERARPTKRSSERRNRVLLDRRRWNDPGRADVRRGLPEGDAEVVDAPCERFRGAEGRLGVRAQSDAERELAGRIPHGRDHCKEEAGRLAPLVVAPVECRGEELGKEVVVGRGNFDAVQAGCGGVRGSLRVAVHQ
jgi:hypothetical protein